MKNISIKMTAALSLVSAVALTAAVTFYTSNTKAQSAPTLSGSCGFVSNALELNMIGEQHMESTTLMLKP
jgi:hypothetical protein